MASTNKTTNYNLSQYIGTDKPTYLGDYNGDMLKIDTQMKTNADNISSVSATASAAATSANSATTVANAASTVANAANEKATSNEQKIENFNLTSYNTITSFSKTGSGTIDTSHSTIYVATNSDGSLAKIYGVINVNPAQSEGTVSFNTSLRPSEQLTIVGGVLRVNARGGVVSTVVPAEMTISTSGVVTLAYTYAYYPDEYCRLILINSLLYIKDFGDTPIPE